MVVHSAAWLRAGSSGVDCTCVIARRGAGVRVARCRGAMPLADDASDWRTSDAPFTVGPASSHVRADHTPFVRPCPVAVPVLVSFVHPSPCRQSAGGKQKWARRRGAAVARLGLDGCARGATNKTTTGEGRETSSTSHASIERENKLQCVDGNAELQNQKNQRGLGRPEPACASLLSSCDVNNIRLESVRTLGRS